MTTILSNVLCQSVDLSLYDFDYKFCVYFAQKADCFDFGLAKSVDRYVAIRHKRNFQNRTLLKRLENSLIPLLDRDREWLSNRGIDAFGCGLNYDLLSEQDKLDLFLYPTEHILNNFGHRVVEGPVFCDNRNGQLVGVCVRNISTDLEYVAASKYTFSNFGYFLYGFDDYKTGDYVYIVEGVFDAIILRRFGYNAIALGSSWPSAFQVACLVKKFGRNIGVCLDNDLHGWCGSFMMSKLLGCKLFLTGLKDPGCYAGDDGAFEINEVSQSDLCSLILAHRDEYNDLVTSGGLVRPLPYN